MNVKLPKFKCLRCGHQWYPKKEEKPHCCGFCKSSYWDRSPDKESRVKARHFEMCGTCRH